MLTIGLTGGIGSGKTTVSNLFNKLGTPIIDTDIIAREVIDNDSSVLSEIVTAFGTSIIDTNGKLIRDKLAKIVFSEQSKKQQLEKILHPIIRSNVNRRIQTHADANPQEKYIIIVIPLLLETDYNDMINRILTVTANEKVRTNRVVQRDNRDVDEIQSIIKSQCSDEDRLQKSDDIIENDSDIRSLEVKVSHYHKIYTHLES